MNDEFTYDIFLSYASPDLSRVRDLAERLSESGLKVWFDKWCIRPGDDVVLAVQNGLAASRTQVLCISRAMLGSEWVTAEANTILFQDPSNVDRRLIPLKLEDCEAPPTIKRFAAIDGRVTDNQTIRKLLSACRRQRDAGSQVRVSSKGSDFGWEDLRARLEEELDPDEFDTWIAPLRAHPWGGHRLMLLAPNQHFVHTLEQSYRPAIDRAIAGMEDPPVDVLFSVEGGPSAPVAPQTSSTSHFDPRYRFENFVVGGSNQFCHAAARAVAESPSHSYNPLFLYGGVGLGKTHLLHAIGHSIVESHPGLRVQYVPAEQFVNELINSIRFDRMPDFRERYRTIDVLLIDDIQFIANKERTQEEFFHTFNTLYTSQKQIILSSDSSPRRIPTLEERLRSRFEWGLIADIQPPELETKVAILRRKAEDDAIQLPDDVTLFIAQNVKSNIRELEGLLNRVAAYSSLLGTPISLDLAKETLRDILPKESQVTASEIIKFVARHFGLKVSEIKSRNNSKHIAFPRQVAMYLCKHLTKLSYRDIGKQFNKHHSAVMHSVNKIADLRTRESSLDRTIQGLIDHFA